jgi:hypothetical protein
MTRWNSFTERKRHVLGKVFSFFEKKYISKGNAVNILQLRIGNGGNTSELDDVNEDPKKSSLFSFTVESPWNCVKQR